MVSETFVFYRVSAMLIFSLHLIIYYKSNWTATQFFRSPLKTYVELFSLSTYLIIFGALYVVYEIQKLSEKGKADTLNIYTF